MVKYLILLGIISDISWTMDQTTLNKTSDEYTKKLGKQIKCFLLSHNTNMLDNGTHLEKLITTNKDFDQEINILRKNSKTNYSSFMLQIDLNEFCNRWNLGHIQLDEDSSDGEEGS